MFLKTEMLDEDFMRYLYVRRHEEDRLAPYNPELMIHNVQRDVFSKTYQ